MPKIYIASFNRASNGAISKLVLKMKENNLCTDDWNSADYVLACGDRKETFDFILNCFRNNKKIIHLWAGEISQGTHDEVYRHSMTLMSCLQLCTNSNAFNVVKKLCSSVNKEFNAHIVGNVMLDNMEIDESIVPDYPYDLILYNPLTCKDEIDVINEIGMIHQIREQFAHTYENYPYIWIEPNGDMYSDLINKHVTHKNVPREQFLGLLKNCRKFITNSSCQYYEAQFLIKKEQIISIGERNKERNSKYANMAIPNASDKIIEILKELK